MTQGLRSNTAHFSSLEKAGRMEPLLILSRFQESPTTQRLCSNTAHFWALKKAGLMEPLLILSPFVGIPENIGVTQQYRPLLGAGEGKGHLAPSNFVPFCGDPRERRGHVAIQPTFGPPRRQGWHNHL